MLLSIKTKLKLSKNQQTIMSKHAAQALQGLLTTGV